MSIPGADSGGDTRTVTEIALGGTVREHADGLHETTGPVYQRGDSLGRYLILDLVGMGAVGAVYAAYDPELDRKVALKLLRPHQLVRRGVAGAPKQQRALQQARRRLEREARALAKLSHPNVVQVYDAGAQERPGSQPDADEAAFDVFVAMEFVEGESLKEWQAVEPRPTWREVLRVYLDACRGLDAAHQAGLIHRDIKPANILLGNDDRVRVVDFGLAAALNRGSRDSRDSRDSTDPTDLDGAALLRGERDSGTLDDPQQPSGEREVGDARSGRASRDSFDRAVDAFRELDDEARAMIGESDRSSKLEARLDDQLTRTGTVMGTPVYMAPEQHLGTTVGPAADQYSLCVALYQALYGLLPFPRSERGRARDRIRALLEAKVAAEFVAPPRDTQAPAWIAAVLRRGMSPRPKARYASMQALIAALEDDPEVRRRSLRRWLGVALGGVVLAAIALFGWFRAPQEALLASADDPCDRIPELLAGVWDQPVRARVRAAFAATGIAYAPETAEHTIEYLDAYAAEWLAAREAQCRAPDDALVVARAMCMNRRRDQLYSLVDIFTAAAVENSPDGRGDADDADGGDGDAGDAGDGAGDAGDGAGGDGGDGSELISKATQAAAGLPLVSDCADDAYLSARMPLPDDPALRAEVEALQPTLARLAALFEAGQYRAGAQLAEAELAKLDEDVYPPALAEMQLLSAYLHTELGDYETAEALSRATIHSAGRGQDHALVAHGWAQLLFVIGSRRMQLDRVGPLMEWAETFALQAGDEQVLAIALNSVGTVHWHLGEYALAQAAHERALALRREIFGDGHLNVAKSLTNLANACWKQGDFERALSLYEQAFAIFERALGERHPMIGVLLTNMGVALNEYGEGAKARDTFTRALAVWRYALGNEHPWVALALGNVGFALMDNGEYRAAQDFYEQSLALHQKTLGSDHPEVAGALLGLGDALREQGQYDQALAACERAVAIQQQALSEDHIDVAMSRLCIAETLLARGALREAEEHLRFGQEVFIRTFGPEHPNLAWVWIEHAKLALARGQVDASVAHLENARTLKNRPAEPEISLLMAKALWRRNGPGERERARQEAERARDAYAAIPNQVGQAAAQAWLEAHPPR